MFETTGKKSELLLKAIGAISDSLPLHALNLLRSCAGACRFEHLCQSSQFTLPLKESTAECSKGLRKTLEKIVGNPIDAKAWDQARIPMKLGGLGIRDPSILYSSSRWAAVEAAQKLSLELGAIPSFVDEAIVKAKGLFFQETGQTPVPIPAYEKMQQQLSNVIYQQMSYRLTTQQTPFHTARLNSLKTPHATSWTSGFSPWYTLSNDAARHGIKWILGLSVNNASYKCNWCGKDADREGLHAVTCQLLVQ